MTDQLQDTSKPWQSKTLWVSLIVAVAPLFPPVQAVLATNPELAGIAVGAVFSVLRLFTKKPVSISSPGAVANKK